MVQLPLLSVFDHFVGLVRKGLTCLLTCQCLLVNSIFTSNLTKVRALDQQLDYIQS